MSTGTQITDMTVTASPLPAGAFVPVAVTDALTGLAPTTSYRFDLGTDLLTRVSYAALGAAGGAALVGEATGETVQAALDHGGFFTPAGSSSYTNQTEARLNQSVSVLDYIPVALHASILAGTNVTHLNTYISNAVTYAITNGFDLVIPRGVYLVKQTASASSGTPIIPIGRSFVTDWSTLLDRTEALAIEAYSFNVTNGNYNRDHYQPISIISDGAIIAVDLPVALTQPTPVIEWNLWIAQGRSAIQGRLTITTTDRVSGNKYLSYLSLDTPQTANNLIGLAISRGTLSEVSQVTCGNLQCGIAGVGAYNITYRDLEFDNCGDNFNQGVANGVRLYGAIGWYCQRGTVFDGDDAGINDFDTEQTANEHTYFGGRKSYIRGGYIEDASPGVTDATARTFHIGVDGSATSVDGFEISGVICASSRVDKEWMKAYKVDNGLTIAFATNGLGGTVTCDAAAVFLLGPGCDSGVVDALPPTRTIRNDVLIAPYSTYSPILSFNQTLPATNFGAALANNATATATITLGTAIPADFTPARTIGAVSAAAAIPTGVIGHVLSATNTQVVVMVQNLSGGAADVSAAVWFYAATFYADPYA